jgi:hypothetical protein
MWAVDRSREIAFAWTLNVAWLNCARHGCPEGMVVNLLRTRR